MLTRQQRAHRIAATELADIDRHILTIAEDRTRHRLCGPGCSRWAINTAAIEDLLRHRLTVQDWRDTMVLDQAWT